MQRVLEPEVMDNLDEAVEYNEMDFTEVNRCFVSDLLAFAAASSPQNGEVSSGLGSDVLDLGTVRLEFPLSCAVSIQVCGNGQRCVGRNVGTC